MSTRAIDAAKAANTLLEFSGDDQQALLEVMTDYFTSPDERRDSDSDEDAYDVTDDGQAQLQGRTRINTKHDNIMMTMHTIKSQTSAYCVELIGEPEGADVTASCEETDVSSEDDEVVDMETRVREATHLLQTNNDSIITIGLPTDALEHEAVSQFMTSGCGCTKAKGKPCCEHFSQEYVTSMRQSCAELTHTELDMTIMGQIAACSNMSSRVSSGMLSTGRGRHKEADREKGYTAFTHQGKPICQKTFLFLHGIGMKRLKNLAASFKCTGLQPRTHGNTSRLPHNALSFSSTQFFVRFMFNYAEQHALLLPGRVPEYRRSDLQLLPSSVSKRAIWRTYNSAAEADGTIHPVAYSTFCYLWRKLIPSIIVMKPRSDLCWQCQQNSTAIMKVANQPEADKSEAYKTALEHLNIVKTERKHYKTICDECKHSVRTHFATNDIFTPPPPCSQSSCNTRDVKVHYSFDYAQQVHYPSDPLQPGPIYFLTPRKCTVFGVACEALPRQINF